MIRPTPRSTLFPYTTLFRSKGQTTALIVDEAQNLHRDVLEEIRLLTNLETTQQKLLQIVLVGQPELDAKLDSVQLRQLKRSEEHTSELQSRFDLVCRLLLEK